MQIVKTIRKFSWILIFIGFWGFIEFTVNPLKFNWDFPETLTICDTITAQIKDIKIIADYKSDPGYIGFKLTKRNKEYIVSTIYQTAFRDSVENKINKNDSVKFWYTHESRHKNQIWQISKNDFIVLPFSTIQDRFEKLRAMLFKSFGFIFLGLIGWIADKTKREKQVQFKIGKRSSMGLMDFISQKFYFIVDKNHLIVRQIGTTKSLETRTHAHIDIISNKIVAIGEEGINEKDLIIKDGFGHERVLIGDFDIAVQVLKYVIRKMMNFHVFLRPIAVVNIKRKLAGGISEVEKRSIIDSFESAGAKEVILWTGNDFSESELMNWDKFKQTIKNKVKLDESSKMKN